MISLRDAVWAELTHAYGPASDIPDLISKISSHPKGKNFVGDPYCDLWSALCHQGNVYSASYAALPHLVELCRNNPHETNFSVAQLAVSIEMQRLQGRGPKVVQFLQSDYLNAVKILPEVVTQMHVAQPSEDLVRIGAASFALQVGNGVWAAALMEMSSAVAPKFLDKFFDDEFC